LDVAPTDPTNAADVKRLVSVGLSSERLSELCGLDRETVEYAAADDDFSLLSPGDEPLLPPLPMPQRREREVPVAVGV
jgi:hypothetical protein